MKILTGPLYTVTMTILNIINHENTTMAKRVTGIEKGKTSRSKKTKKRLAIKAEMLAAKAGKRGKKKK